MFNNIIYFIIVLLVFELGQSNSKHPGSLLYCISMVIVFWIFLAVYASTGFKRLVSLYKNASVSGYAARYNRLVLRLSVISIFIFSLDVFTLNLKYWIGNIPIAGNVYTLQCLAAILLFTFYLSTIWYFANPAHNIIFGTDTDRKAFVLWNIRLNVPVIFPWLLLALAFDLLSASPWPGFNSFLDTTTGQFLFFIFFLLIALAFLPVVIMYFWGCRPIEDSFKAKSIRNFLKDLGVRYRELVNWPLLGGKMMTAGIMGIVPRYRYIMITESLMEVLTPAELNAVMAHEAGHAKYNHQLRLAFLFLGFFVVILGLFGPDYFFIMEYLISKIPGDIISGNLSYILVAIPMLAAMIIYLRFVMGFFMRHFERQADTYAALTIGDPEPIISSLEKIALLSGKIRDLPSWHHFSIRQRVDFLMESHQFPTLINGHRKFLILSSLAYLGVIIFLAYLLYISPVKEYISRELFSSIVTEQIDKNPDNVELLLNLASRCQEMDVPEKAVGIYERIISLDSKQPVALNNLAWLLVTTDDPKIRDTERGLSLAKKAVALEKSPVFLDTLAEAFWVNGNSEMAVSVIKEAIRLDKTKNPYYRKQLEKFRE